MYDQFNNDTICALATPAGGAIAIVRISGKDTLSILPKIFQSRSVNSDIIFSLPHRSLHYGTIFDNSPSSIASPQSLVLSDNALAQPIDEVLVSVFRNPHSYTGEDSAEISCHGSQYIISKILEILIANGCRMANPGEFTQRAYLNGKLDLSQAEAVADLIASTNKATHQMAMSQLRGGISSELSMLREQLLKITSLLELELDFSDHEDLEFADRSELEELAIKIDKRITQLISSFKTGQALKQGIPVAIVGKTNVGKSTLLNKLLKDERAIVSDIHGTTRDTIEDTIDINGVNFRFIDTAGIRQTQDTVEQIGINRTYKAIEKARIILWLIDANPSNEEIEDIQKRCEEKSLIIIQNKIDKEIHIDSSQLSSISPHLITISAKFGTNIDELEKMIYEAANIPEIKENDIIVTNIRHYNALQRASEYTRQVIEGLKSNLSGDLLSEDLRMILSTLAEITGDQITPNEVLGNIFKNFCVGK